MAFEKDSIESTGPCAAASGGTPQETTVLATPADVNDKNLRLLMFMLLLSKAC
jgi:hypothetical protein